MDCRTRLALTTSLLALAAGPAPAQQAPTQPAVAALEEIIVTARKREESLRDVPAAVTALDQRALESLGVASFADLHNKVPELTVRPYPQGGSALTLSMRGISQTDAINISLDPGVGIYLDDVYLARGQALTTDLGDLERIEVLRGPQGTLYGRNTIGGAVKFVTAKPTGRFGFKQKVDYGRFGTVRSLTTVNLPETAGLSLKATYLHAAYDGFVRNRGSGGQFGEKEQQGWRAALRWRPADALTVDYVFDGGFQDGVSPYQQRAYVYPLFPFTFPLQPGVVRQAWRAADLPMNDDFHSGGHALTAAWDIADELTLKSTTSFRRLSSDQLVDSMEAFNVTSVVGTHTKQHQVSEEVNLSGAADGLGLKYILGAFYFREQASQRNMQTLVPDAFALSLAFPYAGPTAANVGPYVESTAMNRSVGGYANVTWTPDFAGERLSIDLGGRYSSDTREARVAPAAPMGHVTHSSFDPSATVDWRWTPELHSYAKFSRGYRTGGFNLRNSALSAFGPERLYSYEVGLKSTLLQGRVFFDAAAFIQKYRDIQLTFTQVGSFPLNVVTVNAGRNTTKGVEAALTVAPVEGLRLSGNLAYLKATNIKAADPFSGVAVAGGFPPPEVPKWAYTLSGEYSLPLPVGTLTLQATWAYNGRQQQYSGQVADLRPGYGLLGARATLGDIEAGGGTASVALWGNNLTDKAYQLYHSFGGVIMGEPRAYGVTLTYSY